MNRLFYKILGVVVLLVVSFGSSKADDRHRILADSLQTVFERSDADPVFDPEGAGLEDYLVRAAVQNQALRVVFYEWVAAEQAAGYSGSLPDPKFFYTYFLENVETRVGPQLQRLGIQQNFPWFGTLGAKKDISSESAGAAYQRFESQKLRLFYEVKTAFYEYYYLGRDIAITRDNLELLTFWEKVARARYRVALKQHTDVIKAQLELGKLEDRLRTAEARLAPAAARLRAVLNLPDSVQLATPEQVRIDEVNVDANRILEVIQTRNPDLQFLVHMIEKNRAAVKLAGKVSYPGFTIGLDYIHTGDALNPSMIDSGKDAVTATVGLSLPIWFGANKARKREAEASYRSALHRHTETANRLSALAEQLIFDYEDALRKTYLYRDGLIPKAEQSLNATYTAYQTGETDFLNLLETQRQLLDFQLQFERSSSDLAIRRAELEMITGTDLSRFVIKE